MEGLKSVDIIKDEVIGECTEVDEVGALYSETILNIVSKEYKKAYSCFKKYLKVNEKKDDKEAIKIYSYIINRLIYAKNYKMAKEMLEEILIDYPNEVLFNNNMGVALFYLKEGKRSIEYFERSLKINPNNEEANRNILKIKSYLIKKGLM